MCRRARDAPTLLGITWAAGVYEVAPAFLRVLLPVVGAPALSVPTAVWSSGTSLGRRLRRARVFSIPERRRGIRWSFASSSAF